MNILEWALGDMKMDDFFARRDNGWYIDTSVMRDIHNEYLLWHVIGYFSKELGLIAKGEPIFFGAGDGFVGDVSDEHLKKTYDKIKVTDECNCRHWGDESGDFPYYQLRGKRLSRENALDMIARTALVLWDSEWYVEELERQSKQLARDYKQWRIEIGKKGYIGGGHHFDNYYIENRYAHCSGGYVWPDGRVGRNCVMEKFPRMGETVVELMNWALKFPYLDIILVITKYDFMYEEKYEASCNDEEDWDDYLRPYRPITVDDAALCIHVKSGNIHFLKPEDGLQKLAEYNAFYTKEDRRQFATSAYYYHTNDMPFDEEYLVRLLTYFGDVPDTVMEFQLEKFRKFKKNTEEAKLRWACERKL